MTDQHELERLLRARAPDLGGEPPGLTGAALEAGLLDVAYAHHDTPVGTLLLAVTARGLVRVSYLDGDVEDAVLADLSARVSPRILRAPVRLDPARRQLDEFFAGSRTRFDLSLDWRLTGRGFAHRVLRATARIPYGATTSYKHVADGAGSPRAFRAAGTALGINPLPIVIPCHRVLHAGGGLGGYTGGVERKRTLLAVERGAEPER
jgi:methylated-DNA-[protein]-cysteine S-methyltransferase